MGYYTELLFEEIELPRQNLESFRDSAIQVVRDKNCHWGFMLQYVHVRTSANDTVDLQISKKMKTELRKLDGSTPIPLTQLLTPDVSDDSESELNYYLDWYPYDGYTGKWYFVDEFVEWIAAFCSTGHLFQLSREGDGELWGWEIANGKFRLLELRPKGRWHKATKRQ